MPANVGEMFYVGETPWHGEGLELASHATLDEALRAGGLKWKVDEVAITTADDPPTFTDKRKAIVRCDVPPGDPKRVVGVMHKGFRPVQNEDAARLFDAIFGLEKPVYETGGYLGNGEVIWLLAKLPHPAEVGKGDEIAPYALLVNSHDGSRALSMNLTVVRVVCQNTLTVALRKKGSVGRIFSRGHGFSLADHSAAARDFWMSFTKEYETTTDGFRFMANRQIPTEEYEQIIKALLPFPKKPRNADRNPGLLKIWEAKTIEIEKAQREISNLRERGRGQSLRSAAGTYWGALNAVTEYIDHSSKESDTGIRSTLLGEGMAVKRKAYRLFLEAAEKAA